ncbi:uncharacterized protein LOC143901378 [Temnothorax americanus]|uniref:uncharacterized protein LOC143901378 n=1 Tax=Temnothorax americanus TaxID=1964332 RepID=UPI004068D19F
MQSKRAVDDRTREFLNYSQRCAYKALKRLTLNKNLNFKPEVWEETSERSRASTDRSIVGTDRLDVAESESPESRTRSPELPSFREMQRRLRETWATNIREPGVKYKPLRSDSGNSSMAPAKSLARSAFSTKFAKYETRESRSASLLDAIPRVSCFRRRNRDRCLSCMHKFLRKASETEAVGPTEIEAKDDSESSSGGLSEIREELQKILYSRRKGILKYPETVEDASSKSTSPSLRMEQEDTDISIKLDPNQSKDKTPLTSTESLLSKDRKSLKATSSSISMSSDVERSKISSSEAHTSDDETSSPLALDNDPSQYKNMAPCHLPTVLLPSMEPLRALRHRKPTTMEARIALMESVTLTKEKSDDEYYDDVKPAETTKREERPSAKMTDVPAKPEKADGKKDATSRTPRALLKVKSQQHLISPIVESARKGELKRGYSCASIEDLSKDSARRTFETPRGEVAEGGRGKVIPLEEIDSAKGSTSSDSVKAERRAELPLLTVAEITRFLEKANRGDMSATTTLESLANEFSSRLIKQHDAGTPEAKKRAKIAARLTKLLVDSERYFNPDKFPSDLVFSTKQPPACNSRLLRRILPLDSYNLVAPLLGMPAWYPKRAVRKEAAVHYETEEEEEQEEEEEEETEGEIPFDLIVHPPTTKDISTSGDEHKVGQVRSNPYALFLRKPRRKVVTWRPLTAADLKGYDPEATLEMRARNITDKICRDFCEWLRGLGGTDSVIDEDVLGDMFEIDFTADASRTMEMSMREMPMVPNGVAAARQCHDAGELAMTRKHLIRDAKAESRPAKTIAFGTALPWELRFVPPGNRVRERWLRCENVMTDLETMDVVWEGITDLESVRAFAKWFGERSKISLPNALRIAMTTDPAKRAVVDHEAHGPEMNVEQIGGFKVRGPQSAASSFDE